MRPRESEGKAKGLDEDDNGAVRSEGSGPQSWARAVRATATTGDLQSSTTALEDHQPPPEAERPPVPYLEYPENFDLEIDVAATCTCGASSASTLATVHRVVGTEILIAATAKPR